VLEQELKTRGVSTSDTCDIQEHPTKVTDEQLVITLEALSACGLLEDTETYNDILERYSYKPYYQIIYKAKNDQDSLIILSNSIVTINEGMGFVFGFRMMQTPKFLRAVKKEWRVSAKKTKVIKDGLVKGTIYSLYSEENLWGFLFAGHAGPYIFYVVLANLDRLDLSSFERIVRDHTQTVAELPPNVELSDIALDSYTINFPTTIIIILSPGPLQPQSCVAPLQEKEYFRNAETYSYLGRQPIEVSVNWSRLQKGHGPANLAGGVQGGMSALAQDDGVTKLKYKTVETTVSGLQGLRVSGSFIGHDGEMRYYEAVCWVKDDEAWNVSTFLLSRDKKAHLAAINIVESVEVSAD
jgi:hypothetical protein